MCKNAEKTAASLMAAIEPTLVSLLTATGIASTPNGQAAIAAYDAALKAVQNWVPGSTAEDVIQVVNAFTAVFAALPIPADAKTFEALIAGGIDSVLTILDANTATPAAAEAASPEEAEAMQTVHAHSVANAGEQRVLARTGYKLSLVTKARAALGDTEAGAKVYTSQWNKLVANSDPKYAGLEIAA